ncbi:MAG: SsrA-binding protein [Chitinophagales bacterium]
MAAEKKDNLNIKNRKARFEYEILDKYTAGIQLTGSEIKSIRSGEANLKEAYCFFRKNELYIKNMHIAEYTHGGVYNHDPLRVRKLLLTKKELKKLLEKKKKDKSLTIVALRLFISKRGFAKLNIALAKGKKIHDKRHSIKERESKRELQRALKYKG